MTRKGLSDRDRIVLDAMGEMLSQPGSWICSQGCMGRNREDGERHQRDMDAGVNKRARLEKNKHRVKFTGE